MAGKRADHAGRQPLAAEGGVDHEHDRAGHRFDRLEDDRPVGAFAVVDGQAVKRSAVDVTGRGAGGEREVVVRAGVCGAAERGADRPVGVGEHRRRPVGPAEEPLCVGVLELRCDPGQLRLRERAKRDHRVVHF